MDNSKIASELLKIAKELTAGKNVKKIYFNKNGDLIHTSVFTLALDNDSVIFGSIGKTGDSEASRVKSEADSDFNKLTKDKDFAIGRTGKVHFRIEGDKLIVSSGFTVMKDKNYSDVSAIEAELKKLGYKKTNKQL